MPDYNESPILPPTVVPRRERRRSQIMYRIVRDELYRSAFNGAEQTQWVLRLEPYNDRSGNV